MSNTCVFFDDSFDSYPSTKLYAYKIKHTILIFGKPKLSFSLHFLKYECIYIFFAQNVLVATINAFILLDLVPSQFALVNFA